MTKPKYQSVYEYPILYLKWAILIMSWMSAALAFSSIIIRGGHTRVFLEIPYGTLESGGLLSVEKDRKKIGYPTLEEK